MEENNYKIEETEIDLRELFMMLKRNILLISVITVVVLGLGILYTTQFVDPKYSADSSMIVQVSSEGSTEYNDYLLGQKLVDTYAEIAKSDLVLGTVKDNLNLSYSEQAIRNMMTVATVNDTAIVKVTIESTSSQEAMDIANEIALVIEGLSDSFTTLNNIDILDVAQLPVEPSSPNVRLNIAISLVLGVMAGVGVVFIKEMFDNTFKTAKDVERVLNMSVISVIPDYDVESI